MSSDSSQQTVSDLMNSPLGSPSISYQSADSRYRAFSVQFESVSTLYAAIKRITGTAERRNKKSQRALRRQFTRSLGVLWSMDTPKSSICSFSSISVSFWRDSHCGDIDVDSKGVFLFRIDGNDQIWCYGQYSVFRVEVADDKRCDLVVEAMKVLMSECVVFQGVFDVKEAPRGNMCDDEFTENDYNFVSLTVTAFSYKGKEQVLSHLEGSDKGLAFLEPRAGASK